LLINSKKNKERQHTLGWKETRMLDFGWEWEREEKEKERKRERNKCLKGKERRKWSSVYHNSSY